jgi:hypothetical protein
MELPLGRPSVPGSASPVGTCCIHMGHRFALDRGCGCFGACVCHCGARSGHGWALEPSGVSVCGGRARVGGGIGRECVVRQSRRWGQTPT